MNPPSHPEVTNLLELEERREQLRKKLRIWHLFLPATGDDVRAYKSLLHYVRPYRGKLIASLLLAFVASAVLALQVVMLQGGLTLIFDAPTMLDVASSGAPASGPATTVPAAERADSTTAIDSTQPAAATAEPGLAARWKLWWRERIYDARDWLFRTLDIRNIQVAPRDTAKTPRIEKPRVHYSEGERADREKLLWVLSIALVVAIVFAGIAKYWQEVLMTGVSRRVVRDIRAQLFRHLMGLSVRFHQRNHSAQLVARITNDLEVFGRFLTEAMVRFCSDFLDCTAMILFIAFNHGAFIFVIAGVIGLSLAPVNWISRNLRKVDKRSQSGMGEIATVISEALVGQRVVKAFASEEREFLRFRKAARSHMKSQMRVRRLRSLTEPIIMGIGGIGTAAVILIGGHLVLLGSFEPTRLIVNCIVLGRAMTELRSMSKQFNDFQLGLAAADRVGTVLTAKSEIQERPDARPLAPFAREIRFEGVHFHHEASKPTLHGIDLVIRKGEKVALVGPSGAGKTTFIDLVPRFFDVDAGRITIDGVDVRDATLHSLREQIGIVSQETILFRDSIRDNVAYGKPGASDEELEAATRAANAHEFIEKKPGGYAWRVGERGHSLSGGERQRIAIARALLRDPPILILDEATSALDSESEAVVQSALKRLMRGRTVIVIAHRLSTIRDATRIVVLEKGRIVEIGNHSELMARPGGIYRRHYEIQTRMHPDEGAVSAA